MSKLWKLLGLMLVLLTCFPFVSYGDNPIITDVFTADPATLVYDGTCYVYVGHDENDAPNTGYKMVDWKVYSSTDMVNWTDRGTALTAKTFSWSGGDANAAQCIYRNGKFYWYVSTHDKTNPGVAIGVAVSDSPTGPFKDALGRALITNDMTKYASHSWDDLDPTVFIDDDGQAYLYWGNKACYWVKLNDDMISLKGAITAIPITKEAFGPGFEEAPWLYKRNGLYYLLYASGFPESIAYSTSSSPAGPWTYRGIIMKPTPTSTTIHPAIVDYKGASYFLYHNGSLPGGGSYKRSVCIQKFQYNSDGTIPLLTDTTTGLNGTMSRMKSYNFQNMYWRNSDFNVKIEANVTPSTDQFWQVVPGLADSTDGNVSFRSVYYPGYYLRQNNNELKLEKHDGSTKFSKDATFKKIPGLKDSSWSSFQSFAAPDLYIRHSNYTLRMSTISTDLDRQDATFLIGK